MEKEKLTEEKAIDIAIELWEYLAEAGGDYVEKSDWSGWDKYGVMHNSCPLCEYADRYHDISCEKCPYREKFGERCYVDDANFAKWENAGAIEDRKLYAKRFLNDLKAIKADFEPPPTPRYCRYCGSKIAKEVK